MRTPLTRLGGAVVCAGLLAGPASAELSVRVSRTVVGRCQSVGITVVDPRGGGATSPVSLTMADGADRRQTLELHPAGKPGVWTGRFTPLRAGRYTGAVMLEREDSRDIGLVPLIRVREAGRPGFLHLHPASRRVLAYGGGGALFPIGVRLTGLRPEIDWLAELRRLRANGVNYIDLPLDPSASDEELRAQERIVDLLALKAEQAGHTGLQLRFSVTRSVERGPREQVLTWVRRWAYSPAVAAWRVDSAEREDPADLVRAIRGADPYHHLIVARGGPAVGADLNCAEPEPGQPPGSVLLDELADPHPWRALAAGSVGLPLTPYEPGTPDADGELRRLSRLAVAARALPLHTPARPVPTEQGVLCRYGSAAAACVSPGDERVLRVPGLPRGRYRVRYWNPETDAQVVGTSVWSSGSGVEFRLPPELETVYVQVEPTQPPRAPVQHVAGRRTSSRRTSSRRTGVHRSSSRRRR